MMIYTDVWGYKQLFYRAGTANSNDHMQWTRVYQATNKIWSDWNRILVDSDLDSINNTITSKIDSVNSSIGSITAKINTIDSQIDTMADRITANTLTVSSQKAINIMDQLDYGGYTPDFEPYIKYSTYGKICFYYLNIPNAVKMNNDYEVIISGLPKAKYKWVDDNSSCNNRYDFIIQMKMEAGSTSATLKILWPSTTSYIDMIENIDKSGMYFIA